LDDRLSDTVFFHNLPALQIFCFHQIPLEQNRCAMACQGCGAVLFLLKSSGITFHNPLLLSYHTKQLN
jgi:hypothetical protein